MFNRTENRAKRLDKSLLCVLLILTFAVLGCSGVFDAIKSRTSNTEGNQAEPDASEVPVSGNRLATVGPDSPCFHKYYPIDTKTVRKYAVFNAPNSEVDDKTEPSATYEFRQSYDGGKTFGEENKFSTGITLTTTWECMPDGLKSNQFLAELKKEGTPFDVKVVSSSGVYFPNDEWTVGKEWDYEINVLMTNRGAPDSQGIKTKISYHVEVLSLDDEVTVPGGDFTAAKLAVDTEFTLEYPGGRKTNTNLKSSIWYSDEVGLVKISQTGFTDQTVLYLGVEDEA